MLRILTALFIVSLVCASAGVVIRILQPAATRTSIRQVESAPATAPEPTVVHTSRTVPSLPPLRIADSIEICHLLDTASRSATCEQRLFTLSARFISRRYDKNGPTGEDRFDSIDTRPLYNLQRFDCVTYIEHVLALSRSDSAKDFLAALTALRYRDGVIGYLQRNHFFVLDWLDANRALFERIDPVPATPIRRTISRQDFFARRGIDVAIPDTTLLLQAWSPGALRRALQEGEVVPGAYVIVFIKRGEEGIDANHVGFFFVNFDGVVFRSASRILGSVADQDFQEYLDRWGYRLEGMLLERVTPRACRHAHSGTP